MGTWGRRWKLLRKLCKRRYETIQQLAAELEVSERTIRRDVDELSETEGIYTQTGRYGGGVHVVPEYDLLKPYATDEQLAMLHKLYEAAEKGVICILTDEDRRAFQEFIEEYTKPMVKKGGKK